MSPNKKCTFGFIGTFGPWHGINILERIIPQIVAAEPSINFLLMGDGVLRGPLEQVLSKQVCEGSVVFAGPIPQQKAPEYLALCDVFLCPTQPNVDGSRFFGSPTKLFEYMSMARPVIASELEQLVEIINPAVRIKNISHSIKDEVGILVDPLDVQGFIDACLWCFSLSDTERLRMGKNARKRVLEHYTWRHHVRKIIAHAGI